MTTPSPEGGERSLGEILESVDYFGDHACLRAIAIAANRNNWRDLDKVLTEEQVAEALLRIWPEFRGYRLSGASEGIEVAHARPYCNVKNCHFSTDVVGVKMPGEAGGMRLHFPTVETMDSQDLTCKLLEE